MPITWPIFLLSSGVISLISIDHLPTLAGYDCYERAHYDFYKAILLHKKSQIDYRQNLVGKSGHQQVIHR